MMQGQTIPNFFDWFWTLLTCLVRLIIGVPTFKENDIGVLINAVNVRYMNMKEITVFSLSQQKLRHHLS